MTLAIGCKPLGSGAAVAADGRGDSFAAVADGSGLMCDCRALVPFAARPQYPRSHPPERSDRCAYNPGGATHNDGSLVVRVQKAASKLTYDEAVTSLLSSYPKVEDRSRAEISGGEATTALGLDRLGVELLGVVYLPRERLVVTTEEHFEERPEGEAAKADYLAALVQGAVPACR